MQEVRLAGAGGAANQEMGQNVQVQEHSAQKGFTHGHNALLLGGIGRGPGEHTGQAAGAGHGGDQDMLIVPALANVGHSDVDSGL